jgi:4-hydroxybenzoate polyprenyltransferase
MCYIQALRDGKMTDEMPADESAFGGKQGFLLDLIRLVRPKQWVKNILVLAAVFFAGEEARRQGWSFDILLLRVFVGFLAFCLLSGAVYTLNDIMDRKRDAQHHYKKFRPIASGRISVPVATIYFLLLAGIGLGISYFYLHLPFFIVACLYVVSNILYSTLLKSVVILDVIIVAFGFVLRAVAGVRAVVEYDVLSPWLLICTFFLALLLATAKRRGEKLSVEGKAHSRPILDEYPKALLDQMVVIAAVTTVIAYAVYTVSPETTVRLSTTYMYYTIPFVTYGVLRYLYLMYHKELGESPTSILLTDHPLQLDIILYVLVTFVILYLHPGSALYQAWFGQ